MLMEVLAEYGTVSFFGINTLSKGVFDLWLNMNDLAAASLSAFSNCSFLCFCPSQVRTMEPQNPEMLFAAIG